MGSLSLLGNVFTNQGDLFKQKEEASVPWDHEADFAEVSYKEVHKALETKPQLLFSFFKLIYFNWKPQLLKRMLCRDGAVVLVSGNNISK